MPASKAQSARTSDTETTAQDSSAGETLPANSPGQQTVTIDRRRPNSDRRGGDGDGIETGVVKTERRKKERRRHIDPTTCERDYSDPEIEFMRAIDDYKRRSGRMFPTCSEVLEVVRDLGYVRLTADQREALDLDQSDAAVTADAVDSTAADTDS